MVTNEFRKRVYEITAQIPRGKVSCYGQIAFLAGHPRSSISPVMVFLYSEDIPAS